MQIRFLLLVCVLSLFFPSSMVFTSESDTLSYKAPSSQLTQENYNGNLDSSTQNLSEPVPNLLSLESPWSDLRALIADGLQGLSESNEALSQLEEELGLLRVETSEQRLLYEESQRLLTSLRLSLDEALWAIDVAVDRMEDAEAYAWWVESQYEVLRAQARQSRRSGPVGLAFGGVSFGVGVPLIVEGLRSDNRTMTWAGAGVITGTGIVWAAGHYIFQWW